MQSERSFEPSGETTDGLIIAKSIATFYNKPIFRFFFFPSFLRYDRNGEINTQTGGFCVESEFARTRWTPVSKIERERTGGETVETYKLHSTNPRSTSALCMRVYMRSAIFFERAHRVGYLRLVFCNIAVNFGPARSPDCSEAREGAFNSDAQPKSLVNSGNEQLFSMRSSHRSLIYVSTANGVRACNEHAHARARWSGNRSLASRNHSEILLEAGN